MPRKLVALKKFIFIISFFLAGKLDALIHAATSSGKCVARRVAHVEFVQCEPQQYNGHTLYFAWSMKCQIRPIH